MKIYAFSAWKHFGTLGRASDDDAWQHTRERRTSGGLARMSWGRGFFRAWVVLSAIWIGFMVFVSEPKTYTWLWKTDYGIQDESGRTARFDLTKSRTNLLLEISDMLRTMKPSISALELQSDSEALLNAMEKENQADFAKAKNAWLLTVVPPIALLGLGLCISWILRGFQRRTA